jgi:hypothetical protein
VHFCLGAPLARIELETSFATLLRRFPRMELVEEPAWKPNYIIRGLEALAGAHVMGGPRSRRSDSNRRPTDYKSVALPGCATPACGRA